MSGQVFTGARAKVYVDNILVGLFDSCSYSVNIGTEAIHLLGRYSPDEITVTSYEAISVSCSGFRIIGNGGHLLPRVPRLQDLLNLEAVTLSMTDRRAAPDAEPVLTVVGCVPVSYSTGVNAKATSRIQVTYIGLRASDEEGAQDEGDMAVNLP